MKNVRIYKDDIRQHILKSLFLTDTTLFVGGGICIAVLLYLFLQHALHLFSWNIYLGTLIVLEIIFVAVITHKVDNQPVYTVFPRLLLFKKSKKNYRQNDLESYFTGFTIQDNLIVRDSSIMKLYEVEAFDIALLNDQDREHFFLKLKQMIHTLPAQLQIITQKEKAKPEDYSKHFFSLYAHSNRKREPLIAEYIKNLSGLITDHTFMTTRHYAVFSVSCNSGKPYEKLGGIKKLHDMGMRFASALATCNITVRPMVDAELVSFSRSTLR